MKLRKTFILLLLPAFLYSQQYFSTSLHYTREGKRTAYSAQNGGFELLTQIPIENLGCLKCHPVTKANGDTINPATYEPDCYDCHVTPGDSVSQDICLKCHARQKLEMKFFSDVHRNAGMTCMDCHTSDDIHGDGNQYKSWLEPGAVDVKCETCHTQIASNTYHDIHTQTVDCVACHVQSVVSCYNCHFESLTQAHVKRHYGPLKGFEVLLRRMPSGKVYSGTFMTLSYQGKSFFVVAPFRAHSIVRNAKTCSDCHNNQIVQEYKNTGKIQVTKWDSVQSKLTVAQGVIPLPPDWDKALKFDFLTYTGNPENPFVPFDSLWTYLKSAPDTMQLYYAEPLTADQMAKLETPVKVETKIGKTSQFDLF